MRIQIFMFLGFIWIVGGFIGALLEGEYIDQANIDIIQEMTAFKLIESQGLFAIPVMGVGFFQNLPQLIAFRYDWLTSGFMVLQLVMMAVTLGIMWGIAQTFLPGLIGAVGNLLRWGR